MLDDVGATEATSKADDDMAATADEGVGDGAGAGGTAAAANDCSQS